MTGDTQCGYVRDAKIETADGLRFGPVTSGWISIEGPLSERHDFAYQQDDVTLPRPHPIYILTMFALYCDERVWGIALKKIALGPNQGCYERVGYFCICDDRVYRELYNAPKQTVTII